MNYNSYLWTPLTMAINEAPGSRVIRDLLLQKDANLNSCGTNKQTALHKCLEGESLDSKHSISENVIWMLSNGADCEIRDQEGNTALHYAIRQGYELTKILLLHGANISAKNARGNTALHRAAQSGEPRVVELLIAYGGDVKATNEDGHVPFMHMHQRGLILRFPMTMLRLLWFNGLETMTDPKGFNALHQMCSVTNWSSLYSNLFSEEELRWLVNHGVDYKARDHYGNTPLQKINTLEDREIRDAMLRVTGDPSCLSDCLRVYLQLDKSQPSPPDTTSTIQFLLTHQPDPLGKIPLGEGLVSRVLNEMRYININDQLLTRSIITNKERVGDVTFDTWLVRPTSLFEENQSTNRRESFNEHLPRLAANSYRIATLMMNHLRHQEKDLLSLEIYNTAIRRLSWEKPEEDEPSRQRRLELRSNIQEYRNKLHSDLFPSHDNPYVVAPYTIDCFPSYMSAPNEPKLAPLKVM